MPASGLVWCTATLMVTIVSCCSLIGVSIMPLISGRFYKSSITLFTGLAVGSLLGSAIFSLIPQAYSLHTPADKAYLWKSLIIFVGIYMFYCSERIMRIYFERKARQQNNRASTPEQLQLEDSHDGNGDADQAKVGKDENLPQNSSSNCASSSVHSKKETFQATETDKKGDCGGDEALPLSDGKNQNQSQQYNNHHNHHHEHHSSIRPHEIITRALKAGNSTPSRPAIHVPAKTSEIAPVAWMIIIGDGLHNFIDGLSIGAAFTESIYQGMIICTAVIFEELPHELGDFAVLISSGMTVRQALGFNFLSACTCYIGMIFGIILGDTTQSASYIFALAAGMFFYISLVDMMGELSAALEECKHSTKDSIHLLLMQNIGIISGISIIFLLSVFGPGG